MVITMYIISNMLILFIHTFRILKALSIVGKYKEEHYSQ